MKTRRYTAARRRIAAFHESNQEGLKLTLEKIDSTGVTFSAGAGMPSVRIGTELEFIICNPKAIRRGERVG